ncbi:hypothetical protein CAOG_02257 [Capsaspora owczarzaki ATCC 30864]|uniref:Sorting nexin-13 n=1 Tax=Capsaspora owczarzaki (strain ATCC 30864) TaxID=595528 RepID=A0A0D2VLR2_CAPO3|nr:hypothetical protein CAOG_02257 [Capsaspora owczarzaki ATCC 30864]KJE91062.1 hypothetical protein CAOG_002257 [Capsaspora owczarzaki ATCC 30864]|eukprot:XP_004349007.1 hypothetical protein CAOG_02257 [Capsaspora owczarzaki ATCC 30864]
MPGEVAAWLQRHALSPAGVILALLCAWLGPLSLLLRIVVFVVAFVSSLALFTRYARLASSRLVSSSLLVYNVPGATMRGQLTVRTANGIASILDAVQADCVVDAAASTGSARLHGAAAHASTASVPGAATGVVGASSSTVSNATAATNSLSNLNTSSRQQQQQAKVDRRMTGSSVVDDVLHNLIDLHLRDYVDWWYKDVSDDPSFLLALKAMASTATVKFANRAKAVDFVNFATVNVVDEFVLHLRYFTRAQEKARELTVAGGSPGASDAGGDEVIAADLIDRFFFESEKRHTAICKSREAEQAYLRDLSELLLYILLSPADFANKPLRILLREMCVNVIFLPFIDSISDPDYINQTIVSALKTSTVSYESFLNAIRSAETVEDVEVMLYQVDGELSRYQGAAARAEAIRAAEPSGAPIGFVSLFMPVFPMSGDYAVDAYGDGSDSSSFLSSSGISAAEPSGTLAAASAVATKASTSPVENTGSVVGTIFATPSSDGEFDAQSNRRHINRLVVARSECEKRLRELSRSSGFYVQSSMRDKTPMRLLSLADILSSNVALSYFMAFVEPEGASATVLLDFWLTVEGYRASAEQRSERLHALADQLGSDDTHRQVMRPRSDSQSSQMSHMNHDDFDFDDDDLGAKPSFRVATNQSALQSQSAGEEIDDSTSNSTRRTHDALKSMLQDEANVVFEQYLATTASPRVPTDDRIINNIGREIAHGHYATCFDEAQQFAFKLIERDYCPRFQLSDGYVRCLGDMEMLGPSTTGDGASLESGSSTAASHLPTVAASAARPVPGAAAAASRGDFASDTSSPSSSLVPPLSSSLTSSSQMTRSPSMSSLADDDRDGAGAGVGADHDGFARGAQSRSMSMMNNAPVAAPPRPSLSALHSSERASWNATMRDFEIRKEDGDKVAVFIIDVMRKDEFGVLRWEVVRRYSDFHDLHMQLRANAPEVAQKLELPPKKTFRNLETQFLETRKQALATYLHILVSPEALRNAVAEDFVSSFLSDGAYEKTAGGIARKMDTFVNPIKSTVKTVKTKLKDEMETLFSANPTKSSTGVGLDGTGGGSGGGGGIGSGDGGLGDGGGEFDEDGTWVPHELPAMRKQGAAAAAAPPKESKDGRGRAPSVEEWKTAAGDGDDDNIPFRILLALLDEVFELKHRNKWLRRRVMALLRQIISQTFGDTINRIIVDQIDLMTSADKVAEYLQMYQDAWWPDGVLASAYPPRTPEERLHAKIEARTKLLSVLTDDLKRIVGSENCRRGSARIFEMLQHASLNRRLFYTLFESFLTTLFGDYNLSELIARLHAGKRKKTIAAN